MGSSFTPSSQPSPILLPPVKMLRRPPIVLAALWLLAGCSLSAREENSGESLNSAVVAPLARATNPANLRAIDSAIGLLQAGDLALRTGADATSHMLRGMNQKNKTFSHCGVVAIEDGEVVVYHSIGGEDNPDAKMRRDPARLFYSPVSNSALGIVRLDINAAQKESLLQTMRRYHAEARTFDMDFDLDTDTALYCAEAVCKAVESATGDTAFFPRSHIRAFRYVAVDDLYENPHAARICTIRFR